ncbi:MAG: nicotinate phosphoribosyltransferase [Spirochaetes bacterium]|nr:nicotinate phosphoribosyltransferase [Spirochaetota bacterium]
MTKIEKGCALFTDFYSLSMAQGYWKKKCDKPVIFEMFFRRLPFDSGYAIFAGLGTLLEQLESLAFSDSDIAYLNDTGLFDPAFTEYLKTFRFQGSLWAMDEGTVVFPNEPLIRVEGSLIECQLIEGLLLNIINFQSLIATKACRVWLASGKGSVMEFGLRRAQGADGALSASRAAYIGGACGTSNTLAGKVFGIPVMGTMAHSWVMSFSSEAEAFDAYADLYPDRSVFILDTYDTLKSGINNAIKTGGRLAEMGKKFGVRLDSGDIQYLSTKVRERLDAAGFNDARILVSNDLDEYIIETLVKDGAPVNGWGVGTRMVTGDKEAAFSGIYKLAARMEDGQGFVPVIKLSDNPQKTTNPGVKQVWRIRDEGGAAMADVISLDDEEPPQPGGRYAFWHPSADYRHFYHSVKNAQAMLKVKLDKGKITEPLPSLADIHKNMALSLEQFDSTYKRLLNPHIYKVSITEKMRDLKLDLIRKRLGDRNS